MRILFDPCIYERWCPARLHAWTLFALDAALAGDSADTLVGRQVQWAQHMHDFVLRPLTDVLRGRRTIRRDTCVDIAAMIFGTLGFKTTAVPTATVQLSTPNWKCCFLPINRAQRMEYVLDIMRSTQLQLQFLQPDAVLTKETKYLKSLVQEAHGGTRFAKCPTITSRCQWHMLVQTYTGSGDGSHPKKPKRDQAVPTHPFPTEEQLRDPLILGGFAGSRMSYFLTRIHPRIFDEAAKELGAGDAMPMDTFRSLLTRRSLRPLHELMRGYLGLPTRRTGMVTQLEVAEDSERSAGGMCVLLQRYKPGASGAASTQPKAPTALPYPTPVPVPIPMVAPPVEQLFGVQPAHVHIPPVATATDSMDLFFMDALDLPLPDNLGDGEQTAHRLAPRVPPVLETPVIACAVPAPLPRAPDTDLLLAPEMEGLGPTVGLGEVVGFDQLLGKHLPEGCLDMDLDSGAFSKLFDNPFTAPNSPVHSEEVVTEKPSPALVRTRNFEDAFAELGEGLTTSKRRRANYSGRRLWSVAGDGSDEEDIFWQGIDLPEGPLMDIFP